VEEGEGTLPCGREHLFEAGPVLPAAAGIVNNRKLKSVYNPGLLAVVLGHVPLGIWYLVEVHSKGMVTLWDWVFAIAYMAFFMGAGMKTIGYGLLADEDSAYPFAPEELERFRRIRRQLGAVPNSTTA